MGASTYVNATLINLVSIKDRKIAFVGKYWPDLEFSIGCLRDYYKAKRTELLKKRLQRVNDLAKNQEYVLVQIATQEYCPSQLPD